MTVSLRVAVFGAAALLPLLTACATSAPTEPVADESVADESGAFGRRAPGAPEELEQFGRLAGRWECRVFERLGQGDFVPRTATVRWSWFYALGGYAIQDVWEPTAGSRPFGTSLRLYDAASGVWRSTWAASDRSAFQQWQGAEAGGDIVMQLRSENERARIVFSEIASNTFAWRYERAADRTWNAIMRADCTRLGRLR